MKDVSKLTNKVVYICVAIGVVLSLYGYFYGFIGFELLFRSILIHIILLALFFVFIRFKKTDKILLKILIVTFSVLSSLFYSIYLYRIELFILVIPESYTGHVEIEINNSTSPTEVKPNDGVVLLEIKKNGKFSTSSNFNIPFNRIQLSERVNGSVVANRHLHLINTSTVEKRDNSNRIYTLIRGTVVKK